MGRLVYRKGRLRLVMWAAAVGFSGSAVARADIFHVDDDAPGDPGPGTPLVSDPVEDGSAEHPFDAIQEAIDASLDGDEVVVADGLYVGAGNKDLDFGGQAIVVHSAGGPDDCVIDCQGAGRAFIFFDDETAASVVEGFTIQNGNVAWGIPGGGNGAAIYCENASPTIRNCVMTGGQAEIDGGAIFCNWGAAATVLDCQVFGNVADGYGGGIALYNGSDATIEGCLVSENQGIAGSGVASFGCSPTLRTSSIKNNYSAGGI